MNKRNFKICYITAILLLFAVFLGACNKDTQLPEQDEVESKQEVEDEVTDQTEQEDDTELAMDNSENDDENIEADTEGYAMHMGTAEITQVEIYHEDFEDGETTFAGRGAASVAIANNQAQSGDNSLFVSGRTAPWNGATVDLTSDIKDGVRYIVSAWVFYETGGDKVQFECKVERNGNQYLSFASNIVSPGQWTELTGSILIPEGTESASVYFETTSDDPELVDFYVDNITIYEQTSNIVRGDIPSLKEIYADYFSMGVAVTVSEIPPDRHDLIKEQFNSLTTGNELKPDSLLDHAVCISDPKYDDNPAINFRNAKPILDFAMEANIPVRGHTLVWHAQTPRWFFTEGYSNDENAPLVSKELMLKRLENYIKNVLEYSEANYPGLIYCWDVVNEAINPGEGDPNGLRVKDSLWYEVIGPEFVEKAFEYARKYAAPDVKLFYNDYNTENTSRKYYILQLAERLKEKGLIDGIGLQSHIGIDSPSLIAISDSIVEYGETGLEIQITELDMGLGDDSEEQLLKQASRYKRLFVILKNLEDGEKANITNVTFWGLSDEISWLNKPGIPSYPLLFDKYLLQKPAFWGVVLSPDIPLY
ncbi:MAG: glycoside hydrolase [Clostridiales bacterium]|nr:glycoside hydrolase [Clostridiales bacterium]